MPPASESAIGIGGTQAAAGPCAALFEAATPALFVINAFRVTGLAVDVSPREIATQFVALELRHARGATADPKPDALSGDFPATLEQIRNAEQRLRSPEHRLIDEIFWFWPVAESGSKSDAALQSVAVGDYVAAEEIWKSLGTHATLGAVAIHNLAIRWHLTALRLESRWRVDKPDHKTLETLSHCWRYAFKGWDLLLGDDLQWMRIERRIRALEDPRVGPSVARQLRKAIPWALASINAALTIAHVEANEPSLVAMHVQLIRDGSLMVRADQFANMVFERAKKNIRQALQSATRRRVAGPLWGLDAVTELVHTLARYDRLFTVLGCAEASAALALIDEGLEVCMGLAVASNRLTGDNVGFKSFLGKALLLAKGLGMRSLVQGNLEIGRRAALAKMLAPLDKPVDAVNERVEGPVHRYVAFGRGVRPPLPATVADRSLSGAGQAAGFDATGQLLRSISNDAWTNEKDTITVSAALKAAMKYAESAGLQSQPHEDFRSHANIVTEQGGAKGRRLIPVAAWCAGAVILSALAIVVNAHLSNLLPQDSLTSSSAVATSIRAVPGALQQWAADSNTNAIHEIGDINSAPNSMADELYGDRRAIEEQVQVALQLESQYRDAMSRSREQELEANDLEQQVREQSTQIDSARLLVEHSDPSSFEDFHNKEDYYNSLVSRASVTRATANALVNPLNTLGQQVSAQMTYVNRVIDDYNAKLLSLIVS